MFLGHVPVFYINKVWLKKHILLEVVTGSVTEEATIEGVLPVCSAKKLSNYDEIAL